MRLRTPLLLAALALSVGCAEPAPDRDTEIDLPGVGDPVSDTGIVGSWMRGNPQNRSVVMVFHDGRRYRFRWLARSHDGWWRIDCDWDGACEEFQGERKVADHTLRVREGADERHLIVEKTSVSVDPDQDPVVNVDEWRVIEGGTALRLLALRRFGRDYDPAEEGRPRARFEKISDRVADPPLAAAGS